MSDRLCALTAAIDFVRVLGIRNTPTLTGTTQIHVGTASSTTGGDCPNGVSYGLDFVERLDFILGDKIHNIAKLEVNDIVSGCVP